MSLTYTVNTTEFGLNVLQIAFTGCETIELELTDFYKDQSNLFTLYDKINEYIATLPQGTQKNIYDVFYKVFINEYKGKFDDPNTVVKLENKIAQVTDFLNYDNFKLWLMHRENEIIFPDNILSDYIYDPDMNTTAEKTYVKRDYVDLIALIIFMRALSPLYIDFYNSIKQVTAHYYYRIFMLFVRSSLYTCPETEKLRTYIEVNQQTLVGNTKNEHLILSAGLSDDDILDSLLSEVVFNKLLTIDFFHKKCNIISFIFQTIRYKGSFAPSDGMSIRGKSVSSNQAKEDISYFEDYRKTSSVPIGTVVEIQHALSDINYLVQAIGKTNFNFELYNQELAGIKNFLDRRMDSIQIYVLGWFLNKIINPRALYYIEYRKLVELALFAKVVLLEDNQHYMAMFLSSYKSSETNYMNIMIRNTVSKNVLKKLTPHYGFVIEEDKISIVEKTISEISKEISNSLWVPIGTKEQIALVGTTSGYLTLPNNINDVMFNYIEYVNS